MIGAPTIERRGFPDRRPVVFSITSAVGEPIFANQPLGAYGGHHNLWMFRTTAHIYDLVYEADGKDYAGEASEVRTLIGERNPGARSLLDVACGTGGHLRHLTDCYDVAGVDVDPAMLAVARTHLPTVPLEVADMRSFALGRSFDAVVCLFSSIGYMGSEEDLCRAVGCMAAHLAPGGVLIVDGWVRPDAWREPGSVHAIAGVRDGVAVVRTGRSWRDGAKTVLDLHHLVATLDGVEHLVDLHELTLFTDEQYERAFALAGLDVERIDSPMPGRDRYVAVASGAAPAG